MSILSKFLQSYPHEAEAIAGYNEALLSGLQFSIHRGLRGHGYDATKEMIDAINILAMGDVPKLLTSDIAFCPEFYMLLRAIKHEVDTALQEGDVFGGWNENFTEGYQAISKALDPIITKDGVLLDDIAEIIRPSFIGPNRAGSDYPEYLAVGLHDITDWGTITQPTRAVSLPDRIYERNKIEAGDILFSMTGRNIVFVPENYDDNWVVSNFLFIIRLKPDSGIKSGIVLMRILASIINSESTVASGNTKSGMLRMAQLQILPIKIPSDENQDEIIVAQRKIEQINDEVAQLIDRAKLLESKQALCLNAYL